jgi:hypothetical protein
MATHKQSASSPQRRENHRGGPASPCEESSTAWWKLGLLRYPRSPRPPRPRVALQKKIMTFS